MSDDRLALSARLLEESSAFRDRARAAAGSASSAIGADTTGSVTVTLDGDGRVSAIRIDAGWRDQVGVEALGDTVREAVQAAAVNRLAAWGRAFNDETSAAVPPSGGGLDRDGLADQLHRLSSGRMSGEDGRAALLELLAMAEDLERGIDEVSAGLAAVESATHTGRSADRHVTVILTGGGEVSGIRYDRAWLAGAHELNIGRQTLSALGAAYESAARGGVQKLIAESRLGQVQRATQDPFGLARRLRLRD